MNLRRRKVVAWICILGLLLSFGSIYGYRIVYQKHWTWLLGYVSWRLSKHSEPIREPKHLFVLIADHFEPGYEYERMARWESGYPKFARLHRDHENRPVQHTWFYPAEQRINSNLWSLKHLVESGFGEVELHHHHNNNTFRSLRRNYESSIAYMQEYGFLQTMDGKTNFGFIHGNFGLDNGNGDAECGVNEELILLRSLGAYADFSFPAMWESSQPQIVNKIYEAEDSPEPKSYNQIFAFQDKPSVRLPMFMGPLVVYGILDPRRGFYQVDDGNIHSSQPSSGKRVDRWVWADIHVPGKPQWVFIKLWGHGADSDAEVEDNLNGSFGQALTYLEQHYDDGAQYVLHYVTAREAYNVARAAAAGLDGDPTLYYNFEIPPYLADGKNVATQVNFEWLLFLGNKNDPAVIGLDRFALRPTVYST